MDTLLSKNLSKCISLFAMLDEALEGNGEGKALTGSLDESIGGCAPFLSLPCFPHMRFCSPYWLSFYCFYHEYRRCV